MDIFRGSWIALNDSENCERFRCPFCDEIVYIKRGYATYPTCPYCLSDMPEAEDFETPEELEKRKWGNRYATGKKYSESREDNERQKAKRRAYYAKNGEHFREYKKKYRAENKEKINAQQRERYQKRKEKNREYARQYYLDHREEILAKQKKQREENPEKFREHVNKCRGRMRK